MLMQVEDLKERLERGNVVIFDCRFSLADPTKGRKQYLAGHIPDALYLDLDGDLSGPKGHGGGRHPLPDPEVFAAKMAQCGVSRAKTVVAYDAGEGMAARAWWLLRYFNHPDVHLLDGGFAAWEAAGFPLEQRVPEVEAADFDWSLQTQMLAPLAVVEQIAAGETTGRLIDARAESRYRGDEEPLDTRAGHIPGAANAPWTQGIGDDGHWLDERAQRARFAPLLSEGPTVMYCGSGVTACNNLFAMELAGIQGAKLYPGSWSEWSSLPDHPAATGNN